MHELDGHGALADGRRASLGRAGADVAGREHPRSARLEQRSAAGAVAREDESMLVSCGDVTEPLRAGRRAEKQEQKGERNPLAIAQRHRVEPPVIPMELDDLAGGPDDDARLFKLVDQIVRHRLAQVTAAVEERYERPAPRQPDGGLTGRVAATDNADS